MISEAAAPHLSRVSHADAVLLQIEDLNVVASRRQREVQRLREHIDSLLAPPSAGTSLKQLAVQASLAGSLREQNSSLSSENESLRQQLEQTHSESDCSSAASSGDDSSGSEASQQRLDLLMLASAFQVLCPRRNAAALACPCFCTLGRIIAHSTFACSLQQPQVNGCCAVTLLRLPIADVSSV